METSIKRDAAVKAEKTMSISEDGKLVLGGCGWEGFELEGAAGIMTQYALDSQERDHKFQLCARKQENEHQLCVKLVSAVKVCGIVAILAWALAWAISRSPEPQPQRINFQSQSQVLAV